MKRSLPLLGLSLLAAACSSSPTANKKGAAQKGSDTTDAGAGSASGETGDPAEPDPGEEPTEGSDDAGKRDDAGPGSGDGGHVDCIFNDGGGVVAATGSGWRAVASLSTIGQTAAAPQRMYWTGHELLVWGNGIGASYNPDSDSWKAIPHSPIGMRAQPVVELAGTKLVVWGGASSSSVYEEDGAIFDLCTQSWSTIAAGPLIGRALSAHAYATTTNELVIWGGSRTSTPPSDPHAAPPGGVATGAAYDLGAGTWRKIPDPAPMYPAFYGSTWTGTAMLMYGGGPSHGGSASANKALSYDPKTDAWTDLASPAIQGRQFSFEQAVARHGSAAATFFQGNAVRQPAATPGDGATFDFATLTWSTIPMPPAAVLPEPQRNGSALFWLGDRFFIWGGVGGPDRASAASGAVYDPSASTWSSMPSGGPTVTSTYDSFGMTMNGEAMVWGDSMKIYRP